MGGKSNSGAARSGLERRERLQCSQGGNGQKGKEPEGRKKTEVNTRAHTGPRKEEKIFTP